MGEIPRKSITENIAPSKLGVYCRAVSWVTAQVFAGGGDIIPENWAEFQAQTGVAVVVSLRAGSPDAFSPPPPLAHLWLPADDSEALTEAQWLLAAQTVDTAVRAGQRALLHCRLGMHRLRPLFAAYLIYAGQTPKAALREVEKKPWLKPYTGDPARLAEFARRVRPTDPP